MALTNYTCICVNVYISFRIAHIFRTVLSNLNCMFTFGHSLSSFLKKKNINFYTLPDGCVAHKIKIPKYLTDHLVSWFRV